jgi:pimeloyl-ACP methyl ester carboxylesterase
MAGLAAFVDGAAPTPRRLILVAATPWSSAGRARRALIAAFETAARPLGYFPARALRIGSDDEPASYVRDLASWVRGSWPWLERLDRITAPAFVVASGTDWMCRPADARAIADRLGGAVTLRVVHDTDHFGFFGERFRTNLWVDLAEFVAS